MNTHHAIALLMDPDTDDDKCREEVIEHMLGVFPDAIVEGAPEIKTGKSSKMVRVIFTSPMFDHVATQMLGVIHDEFDTFRNLLNDSPELTQENKRAYSYVIDALTDRFNAIFGEKE